MSQTKEITEDLWKTVDVAHQARKGYKPISKEFGLLRYTVRQIKYKWRKCKTTFTFLRSDGGGEANQCMGMIRR